MESFVLVGCFDYSMKIVLEGWGLRLIAFRTGLLVVFQSTLMTVVFHVTCTTFYFTTLITSITSLRLCTCRLDTPTSLGALNELSTINDEDHALSFTPTPVESALRMSSQKQCGNKSAQASTTRIQALYPGYHPADRHRALHPHPRRPNRRGR